MKVQIKWHPFGSIAAAVSLVASMADPVGAATPSPIVEVDIERVGSAAGVILTSKPQPLSGQTEWVVQLRAPSLAEYVAQGRARFGAPATAAQQRAYAIQLAGAQNAFMASREHSEPWSWPA